MEKDFTKVAFDIIVLAGQSNAEGNGVSLESKPVEIS